MEALGGVYGGGVEGTGMLSPPPGTTTSTIQLSTLPIHYPLLHPQSFYYPSISC